MVFLANGLDNDNDGMDDQWEEKYHLDFTNPANTALDPDEDGLTNLDEVRRGTDPLNKVSVPSTLDVWLDLLLKH